MREIRQYGSVRGALGDQSPYRDRNFRLVAGQSNAGERLEREPPDLQSMKGEI